MTTPAQFREAAVKGIESQIDDDEHCAFCNGLRTAARYVRAHDLTPYESAAQATYALEQVAPTESARSVVTPVAADPD